MKNGDLVLIDTNAVLEAFRVGGWRALRGGLQLVTVDTCVTETQTGAQRRRPERQIELAELEARLTVQTVDDDARAAVVLAGGATLDEGELDLWAHALTRDDAWLLCGPDRASMRFGWSLGLGDRLVSLAAMFEAVGHRPKMPLKSGYDERWLRDCLAGFAAGR